MIKFEKIRKIQIAVTQNIFDGFHNFKKDVTTDIPENKFK